MATTVSSSNSSAGEMHRGIPEAYFVDDVGKMMKDKGKDAETLLKECDKMYQQYKLMESSLLQKQRKLQGQLVEIKSTLGILEHYDKLEEGEQLMTDFRLNDALFVKAKIERTDKVALWLGAKVMLEYDTPEALVLLQKNFDSCRVNVKQLGEDMDYLRDQITTMEVNMARIYNYDVTTRRRTGAPPPGAK